MPARWIIYSLLISLYACTGNQEQQNHHLELPGSLSENNLTLKDSSSIEHIDYSAVPDTGFVVLNKYAEGFAYDMKYATEDNFLEKAVYSCNYCLVRKEVANALIKANERLRERGLRIKFYDCYRPLDVQRMMWEIFPDARYVANPNSPTGSIHNRGGAVDITLIDTATGYELDMGTGFDHFEKEAHHAYTDLPDTVLANRRLLKATMKVAGFNAIKTEWWHYNFRGSAGYGLSNFSAECD